MQPEAEKILRDVLDAADTVVEYTREKSIEDYLRSRVIRDAVQWNFAVIGEALAQLHKLNPTVVEQISEWKRIIGFRNQLIHGYASIRNQISWEIIEEKLPILQREVSALLKT